MTLYAMGGVSFFCGQVYCYPRLAGWMRRLNWGVLCSSRVPPSLGGTKATVTTSGSTMPRLQRCAEFRCPFWQLLRHGRRAEDIPCIPVEILLATRSMFGQRAAGNTLQSRGATRGTLTPRQELEGANLDGATLSFRRPGAWRVSPLKPSRRPAVPFFFWKGSL